MKKFTFETKKGRLSLYHPANDDGSLNFGYGNSPYFWADFDPTSDSTGFEQVVYPNFMNENKIEWRNTGTRVLYYLYDIVNKVYDDHDNLIGGDLVWASYDSTVLTN